MEKKMKTCVCHKCGEEGHLAHITALERTAAEILLRAVALPRYQSSQRDPSEMLQLWDVRPYLHELSGEGWLLCD